MTWKKGESGNPGGIAKGAFAWREEVNRLEPKAWKLWERCIERGLASKSGPSPVAIRAASEVIAYAHGRPAQTQNVRVIRTIEELSNEEIEALLDSSMPRQIEGSAVSGE